MTATTKALVVWTDGTGSGDWLTRWLAPGFRHCFVAVQVGDLWVTIDPMGHWTEIDIPCGTEYDLLDFYRRQGFPVVRWEIERPKQDCYPVFLFTCVEAVKRVLGIRCWWVWTPRQLFHELCRRKAEIPLTDFGS